MNLIIEREATFENNSDMVVNKRSQMMDLSGIGSRSRAQFLLGSAQIAATTSLTGINSKLEDDRVKYKLFIINLGVYHGTLISLRSLHKTSI